ncbi:MAG: adenosylcobinamide-GDP ribazoletransferase [Chloroflexi bacterium]|nr:adenosylcobinamide-GDP ribazoletransferase [Chloroflexota bacterium]
MNAIRASFGFLTVLPVAPRSGAGMGSARAFFPVVGLALGGLLAGFDRLAGDTFGPELTGALIVVGLLAMTRMLHIDGLMDSCDALLGGFTRERRLEILKDPRTGAFGAIGGMSVVFLKWAAVVTLAGPVRLPMIVLFPLLGRWSAVAVMESFPYGRNSGMGSSFLTNRGVWQPLIALAVTLAASVLIAGVMGVLLLGIVTVTAWLLGAWMAKLLGGVTGDGYGAVVEITEAAALIAAVALYETWPGLMDGRIGFPG